MKREFNVEPTAQIAENIADNLIASAEKIKRNVEIMRETNDIKYASFILLDVTNCISNLRIRQLLAHYLEKV